MKERGTKRTGIVDIGRQAKSPWNIRCSKIDLLDTVVQVCGTGIVFAAEDGVIGSCAWRKEKVNVEGIGQAERRGFLGKKTKGRGVEKWEAIGGRDEWLGSRVKVCEKEGVRELAVPV